jgi:ribonuclease G
MPGKYVVLSANDRGINVSRKINDKALVKEIKAALKEYCGDEDGFGLIARTNCEGLEDMTVLKKEAERITENYRDILRRARYLKAYTNMYSENSGFLKNIQNIRNSELEEIVTDIAVVYEQILACGLIEPQKIRLYKDELLPLNKLYSVENQMKDLLKERVWLKSGGYLVINPTEALTVIDVNTGKYIGDSKGRNPEIKKEEGFYKVNVEAAVEIARQIRLRNYSGIIIIDFIDMKDKEHNERLIEILSDEIKKDPVQTSFVDITKLGLVELTRKKIKRPVHELIT